MEASPKEGHGLVPPGAVSGRLLSMQPDAVLCKLCMRGSDDAFAVLHARYSQQVFAFVFHLLNRPGSVDDAEDLTQEILGKAFSSMSTRRDEGSFKAWLFRIARNHTFDHIRARRPSPASFDDPDFHEEPSNVISLQQEVERRSEMDWLLAAMGRLPDRQREALVMRELGGMSYDEIGETLDTSPEGVKQLIKRGRANVSQAAEVSGYRSRNLKRELGLAAPIVTIGWLGGSGTAAAAAGGIAASSGAVAGGTGMALVGGKTAATVLAVVAVGTGGVVVGEQAASERSASDVPTKSESSTKSGSPAPPAQSLTVGEKAAAVAKTNKIAANKRRALAQERRERARAKAKRAAAAKRSEAAKSKAKSKSAGGRSNGTSKSTGKGNSSPRGTSNNSSGGSKQATENNTGGNGSGPQGGSGQSNTQGSGGGSGNSNAGGKAKE